MKKFLLLLAFCLGVSIANAQVVGFYVDDGVVLSGKQWHCNNLSIIDAGSSNYLIITPTEYYYSYLPEFYTPTINGLIGDVVLTYRPYVKDGCLGWYIHARYADYFLYQWEGYWQAVRIYYAPVYYNYLYNLCGMRYIDMRRWHFAPPPGPRPHHHHHHGTPPHHHGTPPHHPGHNNGTPPPSGSHNQGHGSQRGSGTTVRPSNPPSNGNGSVRPPSRPNGNGSVRPANPPSGGNRGSTTRPANPPSGGSRSGGFAPGSSRSSGGSSRGTVSRPAGGNRGSSPAPRSSGGSSRRR